MLRGASVRGRPGPNSPSGDCDQSALALLQLQMFPRHVLEHMMSPKETAESVEKLAWSHRDVTIMFMDIVGES